MNTYASSKVWTEEAMDEATKAAFVASVKDAPNGAMTKLSSASTDITRRILRENRFVDAILPEKPITVGQMHRPVDESTQGGVQEIGYVLQDIEPNSPSATTVAFSAGPKQRTFRGAFYRVDIGRDETPELYKHVDELATYSYDLRSLIVDNMLRDFDQIPDYRFIATIDGITGSDVAANGSGGHRQYREVIGQITRETYKATLRPLIDANLNNGVFLMNRATAIEFLGWGRDEIGGDLSEKLMLEGLSVLETFKLHGIPHIATIKTALVPLGRVYHFVPSNWFGRHYVYEDTKVFVERKKDYVYTSASRKYGIGIGNNAGCAQTNFTDL